MEPKEVVCQIGHILLVAVDVCVLPACIVLGLEVVPHAMDREGLSILQRAKKNRMISYGITGWAIPEAKF